LRIGSVVLQMRVVYAKNPFLTYGICIMTESSRRRYDYLVQLAGELGDDALVVTNLANTATEWFAARPSDGNLYAVGMGMVTPMPSGSRLHCRIGKWSRSTATAESSSILRSLACLRRGKAAKLRVIVFDNGGYISTGKLPAVASLSYHGVEIAERSRAPSA